MKTFKTEIVSVEKRKLESITCNKCGNKCSQINFDCSNYVDVYYKAGYGSPIDGDEISFELCEKCLLEFMESFKIKAGIKVFE